MFLFLYMFCFTEFFHSGFQKTKKAAEKTPFSYIHHISFVIPTFL